MSWAEIKKAVNSDLSKPLDTLIGEVKTQVTQVGTNLDDKFGIQKVVDVNTTVYQNAGYDYTGKGIFFLYSGGSNNYGVNIAADYITFTARTSSGDSFYIIPFNNHVYIRAGGSGSVNVVGAIWQYGGVFKDLINSLKRNTSYGKEVCVA